MNNIFSLSNSVLVLGTKAIKPHAKAKFGTHQKDL